MSRMLCLFVILSALLPVATTAEMIFKCVDESGLASYQSTDCAEFHEARDIDLRYSNVGQLGVDDEEQIARIHAERRQRAAESVAARERAIQQTLARHEAAAQRCEELKSALQALYQKRRFKHVDRDEQDQLSRQMRDACAY